MIGVKKTKTQYILGQKAFTFLCSGTFVSFLAGLGQKSIQCVVHVALPKRPIIQFKPDQQSRQQLKAYRPNIYTVNEKANSDQLEAKGEPALIALH